MLVSLKWLRDYVDLPDDLDVEAFAERLTMASAEVEGIDFARVDLSELTQDLMDGSREPSVSLPDSGDTGTAMRTRIRDFYRRGQ